MNYYIKYPSDDKLNEYKIIYETNKNNHKVEEIKEVLNIDSNNEELINNKSSNIKVSIPDNYSYVHIRMKGMAIL